MSKNMKKVVKVVFAAAAAAAAGIALKKWLEGRRELEELSEEELFEAEAAAEELLEEKFFAEAKTIELAGELPHISLQTVAASVTYDLSNAVMTADRMLDIQAYASNVRVECPIGIRVQMTGEGVLSSLQCSAPIPEAEAAPTLYIHVSGVANAVFVK